MMREEMSQSSEPLTVAFCRVSEPEAKRLCSSLGVEADHLRVRLRTEQEIVETLDAVSDMVGLLRIEDLTSPRLELLSLIARSRNGLCIKGIVQLPFSLRWVRLSEVRGESAGVAVRRESYEATAKAREVSGVPVRVLPDDVTTHEIIEAGLAVGAAVVDVDEVDTNAVLDESFHTGGGDVSYGVLGRGVPGSFDSAWLRIVAEDEQPGVLADALHILSGQSIDLEFLYSEPRSDLRHWFHLGFEADPEKLSQVVDELTSSGFAVEITGAFRRPDGR